MLGAAEEYSALLRSRCLFIKNQKDSADMRKQQVIRDWSNISRKEAMTWNSLDYKGTRLESELKEIRQKDRIIGSVLASIKDHTSRS